MLEFEKIAGRVAILVPLLHLVACGLYMAGYSAGFGSNIGGMFSTSDFFTITIQHLITTYVLGLGMPVAVILLRHRSERTYAVDLIAKEDDPTRKAELVKTRLWVIKFGTWALPILGLLSLAILAIQIWAGGARDYYLTLTFALLALLPAWWNVAERFRFYGLPVELTWCALAFVVGVVGLGMDSGDRDRRWPRNALSDRRMHCGNQVVLRPIGDRFISVSPDNRRHLIDDECKIQFDFVPTTIIPMTSLYDLVQAKLAARPLSKRALPSPEPTATSDRPQG